MTSVIKELDNINECSICTEAFTDPRVLPCVHTYCLKCILTWAKDKSPGDKLACPLCRNECTIPDDGLRGLPRNFFVEKILHVKELTKVGMQSTPCDMCTYRAKSEATQINPATNYCLVCQENYCEPCSSSHGLQRATRGHRLLQIGGKVKPEYLLAQYPPNNCDKHTDETLKIYCNDDKLVICMMCYIKEHNTHKCSHINEVIDEFRKQMNSDVTEIADGVKKCKEMLQRLSKERQDFNAQAAKAEREIREKMKSIRQMVDRHEESLLSELQSLTQKRTKAVDTAYEEVEQLQVTMERYTKYVHEIQAKGTACDIAGAASGLHGRAEELLKFDDIERMLDDLGRAVITFSSSNFPSDDFKKAIGELSMNVTPTDGMSCSPPRLTHVLPGDTDVRGVTSLGDKVYVVRSGKKEVEVYDIVTFQLLRRIPVPQLQQYATGIAACDVNQCLYLSDYNRSVLVRVDLNADAVTQWSVATGPHGLSVTSDHNVLVTCLGAAKLQEYTTDGNLAREICLQSAMKLPWQATHLSTGHYVVSQWTSPGVVGVVGVDGQVVRSFGESSKSDVGPMKYPTGLAVTKHGDVLVADEDNHRILAIDSAFTRAQVFPLPTDLAQLQYPRALYLDESRDLLYICESSGDKRVIVLDSVRKNCWK